MNYVEFARLNGFVWKMKVVSDYPVHVKWYMGETLIFQQYGRNVLTVNDGRRLFIGHTFNELDVMTRSKHHRENMAGKPHHVERKRRRGGA